MIENIFNIKGKIALVTGGAKGIGAMISQGLVEAGVKVYVSSRSIEACDAFAKHMSKIGECIAIPKDLSKIENIESLSAELNNREEKLDILINNSGVSWGAPIDEFPEKGWDKVMDLNVKSVFFMTQKLLPLLRKSGSKADPARVINISSVMAQSAQSLSAYSYGPSKAAVQNLSRLLAKDLINDNILVNSIAPGFFPSNMTRHFNEEELAKINLIGRAGEPEDIAGLVIFLCSRAGSFMTGTYIPTDGGFLLK